MAIRPSRQEARRHPGVLNPALYALLRERIGPVAVSKPGLAPAPDGVRVRADGSPYTYYAHPGEGYNVSCPWCNDTRQRLSLGHLYGAPDPLTGDLMWGLAYCFNANCLATHGRDLRDRLFAFVNPAVRQLRRDGFRPAPGKAVGRALDEEAPLPGAVVPLGPAPLPSPGQRVRRGPRVRPARAGPGLGRRRLHEGRSRLLPGRGPPDRPHVFQGVRIGWQGRYVGDIDWKAMRRSKYYTMAWLPKSQALYNYDLACTYPLVVVCEGVFDVWAVGAPGVALLGKSPSARQQVLLRHWVDRGGVVVLLLDPDAWEDATWLPAFKESCRWNGSALPRVVEVHLPEGRDAADFGHDALWKIIGRHCLEAGFPLSQLRVKDAQGWTTPDRTFPLVDTTSTSPGPP